MANYDRSEQAEWSLAVTKAVRDYKDKSAQALEVAAGRGFVVPPGEIQDTIVRTGLDTKHILAQANGEIYKKALGDIYKEEETSQKIALGLSKIDLGQWKASLDNMLDIKQAEDRYELDAYKAQIEKLKSDIDFRQAAIIEEEAKVRDEIRYYKQLLINAERISLGAEVELIQQKVLTAEKKLEIIPYLYQVIEAERLVADAEKERATSLQEVLVWEQYLMEVKKEMIPYYLEKADARTKLADAVRIEADSKEALERLGFDKLALRNQEKLDQHTVRLAELAYEEARMRYIQATAANELARAKAQTELAEYSEHIRSMAIELEEALKQDEKGYKMDLAWFWKNWELWHEALWNEFLKGLRADELAAELEKLIDITRDTCRRIRASAKQESKVETDDWMFQYVSSG